MGKTSEGGGDVLSDLDDRIWKTKGARFNAARRLQFNHYWSTAAIAFLSVYVSLGSVVLLQPAVGDDNTRLVWSVVLIGISMMILVLSLLESSRSYQLKADRLHRCGMQLNEIYSELRLLIEGVAPEGATPASIAQRYHSVLQAYDDNHSPIDAAFFEAQHAKHFNMNGWTSTTTKMTWYARATGPYVVAILAPLIVFSLLAL